MRAAQVVFPCHTAEPHGKNVESMATEFGGYVGVIFAAALHVLIRFQAVPMLADRVACRDTAPIWSKATSFLWL